jgi:hypothetical protein
LSQVLVAEVSVKLSANKKAQEKILANPKASILFEHEPHSFKHED